VYVYLNHVCEIERGQTEFAKKIYKQLQVSLLKGYNYQYIDTHVIGDINRLCRIPLSIHQKTGEECVIVDNQLRPDKIRSVEFFKLYGLKDADIGATIRNVIHSKNAKFSKQVNKRQPDNQLTLHTANFKSVRPCFRKAMDAGEMVHQQRLALLHELYATGCKNREEIIDVFRCFNDFNESKTSYQVNWFFDNEVANNKIMPYSCRAITVCGWCLSNECALYRTQAKSQLNRQKVNG
jgi:hypothetical protein